ncbi:MULTISPECIES: folate-binding protein [unclassified Cobetia]|uniref:CAF17-like 4Fe-4S cluster assembly/insertion protein YgfZ n=1 Tax=unclassified Cobetia TaxID=2609414 RepID=UPI002015ECD3|nr:MULTISPECIES: folate-binding protein [unclassified Cobetia]|tara:strand:- start:122 stop:1231 length:1110 start_codon:yes stop_codon:yes gene_type:complete
MNPLKTLMQDHGYQLGEDGRLTLGEPADASMPLADMTKNVRTENVLAPLNNFEVLEVCGKDGERFLQGQTSQQLSLVDGELAPLTTFCTPKGRILAMAQLLRVSEERLWLVMPAGTAEPLRAHLAKFAPFYKVTLEVSSELSVLGLLGEQSLAACADALAAPALAEHDLAMRSVLQSSEDEEPQACALARQPSGNTPRAILVGPHAALADLATALFARDVVASGDTRWGLEDIRAGLQWVTSAQTDSWLPQMLNLEALAAISFKKGCYTGQEVVARAHFRGQVKKRLQRLTTAQPADLPAVGSKVTNPDGKSLGEVLQAAHDEQGRLELLAVISLRDEEIALALEDGTQLERSALPYAVERRDPEQLKG